MYKLFLHFCLLALATAASVNTNGKNYDAEEPKEQIAILKSAAEKKPDGSFSFSYEGADGSYREEVGQVVNAGEEEQDLEVTGSYRYYDADGQLIEVTYTAGKSGFIPQGTNIPQEISDAAKAAAEAATHEIEENARASAKS